VGGARVLVGVGDGTDEEKEDAGGAVAPAIGPPSSGPHATSENKGTTNKTARVLRRIFPPRQQWQNEAEP
jgi:hypothetical protein